MPLFGVLPRVTNWLLRYRQFRIQVGISRDEVPRQRQRGIRIEETTEEQQRSKQVEPPTLYSLTGGMNKSKKGKEKVVDVASKYRGGFSAFSHLWRPQSSRWNGWWNSTKEEQRSADPVTVTEEEKENLKQPFRFNIDDGLHDYEGVLKDCNTRFSENVMAIFKTSSSELMGQAS